MTFWLLYIASVVFVGRYCWTLIQGWADSGYEVHRTDRAIAVLMTFGPVLNLFVAVWLGYIIFCNYLFRIKK